MIVSLPPAPILYGLIGVFCMLLAATLVVFVLTRIKPDKEYGGLKARTLTFWGIVLVIAPMFILGPLAAIAFTGIVSFLAFKEYLGLIPTRPTDRRVLLCAYLAIPLQYCLVLIQWYGLFTVFIPVYAFPGLAFGTVLTMETKNFLMTLGALYLGLMITVYNLSHLAYLFVMPLTRPTATGGAGLCFYLVTLTALNDSFQYVWGKCLGRRKVMPAISPGKTWAGLIGGVATCAATAVALAPFFTPFDVGPALGMGFLIGGAGFAGDVTMSALKRDIGIKDTGSVLPGHGGILDRLDSFTFTAPLFFHVTRYFYGA